MDETPFGAHAAQSRAGKMELHLAQSLAPGHMEGPWPGAGQTGLHPPPPRALPLPPPRTPFPVVGLSLGLSCPLCEMGTVAHPGREEAESFREGVPGTQGCSAAVLVACWHVPGAPEPRSRFPGTGSVSFPARSLGTPLPAARPSTMADAASAGLGTSGGRVKATRPLQ